MPELLRKASEVPMNDDRNVVFFLMLPVLVALTIVAVAVQLLARRMHWL